MTSLQIDNTSDVGADLVKVQKSEIVLLVRRLQGFQNTHLILEEKENELKELRGKCQLYQARLEEMQQQIPTRPRHYPTRSDTQRLGHIKSKSVEPEFFLFPDTRKRNSLPVSSTKLYSSLDSSSLESDGREDDKLTQSQPGEGSVEGMSGSSFRRTGGSVMDWSVHTAPVPGVSEQYFVSIIDEMVKTKKYIHSLLQVQRDMKEKTETMAQRFKSEISALQKENADLKEQLKRSEPAAQGTSARRTGAESDDEDSLEIESLDKVSSFTDSGCQTDSYLESDSLKGASNSDQKLAKEVISLKTEVEQLKAENKVLLEKFEEQAADDEKITEIKLLQDEISVLQQKLSARNSSVSDLESGVKVISQCMQEEKKKNRQLEQKLSSLRAEQQASVQTNMQLTEKLAYLRNENETLRQEKRILEKLQEPMQSERQGNYQSTNSSGGSNISGNINSNARGNISGSGSTRSFQGSRVAPGLPASSQPRVPSTHAAPLPVVRHSTLSGPARYTYGTSQQRDHPAHSNNMAAGVSHDPSYGYVEVMAAGQDLTGSVPFEESQPHQTFVCPYCLRNFSDDIPYLEHLQKCVNL